MFVIILTYLKPIEDVDEYLDAHRDFLERGYQKGYFLVSGPQYPREGGIILSLLSNKQELMEILAQDPFHLHEIAEYQLIEFEPVKYHACLVDVLSPMLKK